MNPYVYECAVFHDFHDPLAVRRALMLGSRGLLNEWIAAQAGPTETVESAEAHEKLLPVVRAAFGLPPVDRVTGYGVTDQQALLVLDAFLKWLAGKV